MTLNAFRGSRFGFLPGLFAVHSRRFYHDLSTGKAFITLHAAPVRIPRRARDSGSKLI
jgi:hypothetical protein